jgi:hypothetical protein
MLLGMIKPTTGTPGCCRRWWSGQPALEGWNIWWRCPACGADCLENLEVARRCIWVQRRRPARSSSSWGWQYTPTGERAPVARRGQRLGLKAAARSQADHPEPALGLDQPGSSRSGSAGADTPAGVTVFMSATFWRSSLARQIGIIHEGTCSRNWISTSWSGTAAFAGETRAAQRVLAAAGSSQSADGSSAQDHRPRNADEVNACWWMPGYSTR